MARRSISCKRSNEREGRHGFRRTAFEMGEAEEGGEEACRLMSLPFTRSGTLRNTRLKIS